MPAVAVSGAVGFYGKVPAAGDFVTRRLDAGFVAAWDGWMQAAIVAARAALGADWLPLYLRAPIWRFALGRGACGGGAAAGVMMPSVDKVGRYFPLCLAAALPADAALLRLPETADGWYARLEAAALAALDDGASVEAIDTAVAALSAPAAEADPGGAQWAVTLDGSGAPGAAALAALAARAPPDDLTVWWTTGSDDVAAACLASRGLPAPPTTAAFLDGRYDGRGWTVIAGGAR